MEQHPLAAYAVVFLLAMSEALPGIGIVVPGTAVILGVSTLVPSGVVRLWPLMTATMAGAIVGDGLSFWLGHRYQRQLLAVWPMSRYPDIADKGEAFFKRYGAKSVFLARFIPGVRAVVPLFAGIAGMPAWRFYLANILSAIAWTLSHVLPAVFVGAAVAQAGNAAKPLAALAVLLLMLLWVAWKLVRLTLRYGLPWLTRILAFTRDWSQRGNGFAARIVARLLGRTPNDAIALLVAVAVIVAAAWVFLGVLEDVVNGDPLVQADNSVFQGLTALRTPTADAAMIALTELGDTLVVTAVTAVAILLLLACRAWRSALFMLIAVGGGSLLNTVIKGSLHRARPGEMAYQGWSEFSFPSGHSTMNAILYGFLAVLVARELRPAWRFPVAFAAMFLALAVAFSRVYLGAHWFSDVVAGLSFGSLWLAVVSLVLLRGRHEPVRPGLLAGMVGLAVVVAGGFNIYHNHQADMRRYAVRPVAVTMPVEAWLQDGWQQQPTRRVDLTGEIEEPFTLQIAGPLAEIESRLAARGWKLPPSWLANAGAWLTPHSGPADVPVFPLLASGRLAELVMIRPDPDGSRGRTVLRLWPSDLFVLDGQPQPVWVASVIHEKVETLAWVTTRTSPDQDASVPRDAAAAAFNGIRRVKREDAGSGWDGTVILVPPSHP